MHCAFCVHFFVPENRISVTSAHCAKGIWEYTIGTGIPELKGVLHSAESCKFYETSTWHSNPHSHATSGGRPGRVEAANS